MDILAEDRGSTIIETLVGIIILGIIITLSFSLYMKIYTNTSILYKSEAITLANQEIFNCIRNKITTDTLYNNINKNLTITRKITVQNNVHTVIVKVSHSLKEEEILSLTGVFIK
ncbi:MAG: hypothetical protein PVH88_26965 [Ignavibacteria bacterium]|jgi:hypothetical protein